MAKKTLNLCYDLGLFWTAADEKCVKVRELDAHEMITNLHSFQMNPSLAVADGRNIDFLDFEWCWFR